MLYLVRLFAPYGTLPKQGEYQGIFTTKEKAMERVHFWKDSKCVDGYTCVIYVTTPDTSISEKIFELQL